MTWPEVHQAGTTTRRPVGRCFALLLAPLLVAGCGDSAAPDAPGPLARLVPEALPARGITGEPLPTRPAVRATDARGQPVPGVEVVFEVLAGGGTLRDPVVAVSDGAGVARAGEWILGSALGPQDVSATALDEEGQEVGAVLRVLARWRWTALDPPQGDPNLTRFLFHPSDGRLWYALSIQEGLYVSRDAGETWIRAVSGSGLNNKGLAVDPAYPDTVFIGVGNRLLVSGDRGQSWILRHTLEDDLWIRSIAVLRDGSILVAPQWPAGGTPGVFRSEDRGMTWAHHPYGAGEGQRILTWVLREHPASRVVWSGNEIADHPQPYYPPFLASSDGGRTWTDITADLPWPGNPWHIVDLAVAGDTVYALSEGAGLFRSDDRGATWRSLPHRFAGSIMTDPRLPGVVFGSDLRPPFGHGGVVVSFDGGTTFSTAVEIGHSVGSMVLGPDARQLFVASWGGGLAVADLP